MSSRRPIYLNPSAASETCDTPQNAGVLEFHKSLPNYAPTPLVSLPDLAVEFNVKGVLVKDESRRFSLPSFKILGASWGCLKAVAQHLELSPTAVTWQELGAKAKTSGISLVTATEGNHGRAVAYMANLLGIEANVYVPLSMNEATKGYIKSEGARVIVAQGTYDDAVQEAAEKSKEPGSLLIQDTAFEGYEDVPSWIVQGYSTMLNEVEEQASQLGLPATTVITPVGVGSLAHSVATHCKSRNLKVFAVEPDSAPCLFESLRAGKSTAVQTSSTIMDGMNCGTVSATAWPDLKRLVDASVTVSSFESHRAVEYLSSKSVHAGPCGGASLAALQRLASEEPSALGKDSVIVLLSTEGSRVYQTPRDVSVEDAVGLTQNLTQINSSNPTLSVSDGVGESEIADYLSAWFAHRDIEFHRIERVQGRPSVVGVLRGNGGGKSLMFNGHIDTVSLSSYEDGVDPLSGAFGMKNGEQAIFGRGSLDMKGGVAASLAALANVKSSAHSQKLRGDIIVATVSDEEDASQGTQDIIAAGWRADAAIVPEPTMNAIVVAHKGFVWVEIEIHGVAAHGSDPASGVDAIIHAGRFLRALEDYQLPVDDLLGKASMHCGLIRGGEEPSSYPGKCTITVEFRTIPSQSETSILDDIKAMLAAIAKEKPDFRYSEPRVTMSRPTSKLPKTHSFVQETIKCALPVLGNDTTVQTAPFWCDAALLGSAGIPSIVFGPVGAGLHSKEEWVQAKSLQQLQAVYTNLIKDFCQ